jgi:hypothetical protein
MPIHVAILMRPYLRLILEGRKTIESRLTMRPIVPFRAIRTGERIFFKASSGPFMATAIAGDVFFHDGLTRASVAELRERFNDDVCGDAAYWNRKRDCKCATFIELTRVHPISQGPAMAPSSGLAWFVLPDALGPRVPVSFDVVLTAGAIRNHYLRVPKKLHAFDADHYGGNTIAAAGRPLALVLPDGTRTLTDIASNHMIRWRGWLPWFKAQDLAPGDVVRFTERDDGAFAVSFLHRR